MKKVVLSTLALMATLVAGQAWAGVSGSAHDMTAAAADLNTFGVCSACHIPHKAVGDRLWPKPINGTNAARGDVGNLCTYCHDLTNGVVDTAKTGKVFVDTAGGTHGLVKDNAPEGPAGLDPTLPYCKAAAGDTIQCTSCHNVHEQQHDDPSLGKLAFLQDDIDALCSRCHPSRQFASGAASTIESAWGTNLGFNQLTPADGNPGSHPVGTDVTGDSDTTANSPITIATLGLVTYGVSGDYNLGPKAIGGAQADISTGMGCVTCHMVHGSDIADPVEDLLAIDQVSSPANGAGQPNNALCEACHQGTKPVTYGGAFFPNPGAGLGTHPVDNYYNAATAWTITPPVGWPMGSGGESGTADLICESCHMPHPLASTNALNLNKPEATVATNTHILRDADLDICDRCHTGASIANHHPVGDALMVAGIFVDANVGDQDADLECSDCHNGQGAHNWSDEWRVGLDPDWLPADNGRGTETEGSRFVAETSLQCAICHTNNAGRFSPTLPHVAGEYQNAGDASHFIGARNLSAWDWGGTAINPNGLQDGSGGDFVNDPWDDGGYSRFGGTDAASAEIVCESCHDVEPDKNAGNNALLLEDYLEDKAESRSSLCEGCHSDKGTDSGSPHPMSGDTISRASTAGRTIKILQTVVSVNPDVNTYADRGDLGDTTYPANNEMNCDSCHQPHNAVEASGTYILEGAGSDGTDVTGTPEGDLVVGAGANQLTFNAKRYTGGEAAKLNYQEFCNLCHSSGM